MAKSSPKAIPRNKSGDSRKDILARINKHIAQGFLLGEQKTMDIECLKTGSMSLDAALGGRGVPRGRIIELFGSESSGKTTLALQIAAEAQRLGGSAAIIDAEHAFDPEWAVRLGVNPKDLYVIQPDDGEQGMSVANELIKGGMEDVIIVDSVAALTPRKELDGEIGDSHVGLQARLMSQSLRMITGTLSNSHATLILINQLRDVIGGMGFGPKSNTPGGRAIKFYASQRIELKNIGQIKEGEERIGQRVRATVVKNKIAPPFRKAEFDMMSGVDDTQAGVSYAGELLDMGLEKKVITKSGSWFKFGSEGIGAGRQKARLALEQNQEWSGKIRTAIEAAG